MKRRTLNAKYYCSFWSSSKRSKGFLKSNDSVKSSLQKRIISRPYVIQYPISNYYITVKFDSFIRGVKTEIRQNVLLWVSVSELNIDILKNILLDFPWYNTKNKFSVLVILVFGWFFRHSLKNWPSAIKLFVVAQYSSKLEHTKIRLIIGISGNWDI